MALNGCSIPGFSTECGATSENRNFNAKNCTFYVNLPKKDQRKRFCNKILKKKCFFSGQFGFSTLPAQVVKKNTEITNNAKIC